MSVQNNLFRLSRMIDVISQFFFQIRKVIFNFNIVIIRNKFSFHEPCFTSGTCHYGNGVGRHHPLQIGGHIITFQSHNKLVVKMLTNCFLGSHPLIRTTLILTDYTAIADCRAIIHVKKLFTDTTRAYLTTENSLIGFFRERNWIFYKHKMA